MSANLIKSIRKSLGNEALEKRVTELEQALLDLAKTSLEAHRRAEARILALEAQIHPPPPPALTPEQIVAMQGNEAPKKRKARAKTYGTE